MKSDFQEALIFFRDAAVGAVAGVLLMSAPVLLAAFGMVKG